MATEPDKCMENLLRAAFTRGYAFGSRYPEVEAIPIEEADIQFRAWWDDWHGNTWSPEQWLAARTEKGLVL